MDEQYVIEDAVLEDLGRIVDIYNETITGRMVTADLEPITVASRLLWFEEHAPDFRPLWVLKEGERIVAWLSFQSFYGRPAYLATAEISIYISAECRGKGLGSLLLQRAIDFCPRIAVNTLLGFVFAHNQPSLSLLEKFGFERWAHLPRVANMDGIERDLVILGRRVEH
ncbi:MULTISPECIES: GNAT family N-acetyltransferase [unclassified Paenibacillus]|uniref:GNAT family N-acetyltransferase n=1 Tax=unclassified Paenibacillus TaxID=185978 RepID=UPI0008383565|nr:MULTISPECIES: GNAT family N-acetyltransferase [unclassified Paenibacillus]NWL86716.1 N-acetyltransferase [Paenibacillus sp. 79R4]